MRSFDTFLSLQQVRRFALKREKKYIRVTPKRDLAAPVRIWEKDVEVWTAELTTGGVTKTAELAQAFAAPLVHIEISHLTSESCALVRLCSTQ